MPGKLKNIVFTITPILILLVLNGAGPTVFAEKELIHKVFVEHPGKSEANLPEFDLVEIRGNDKIPVEYYMNVASVYCYDSVCKVVPVQISWNNLGDYNSYKLESGFQLEKAKGEPFLKGDYEKLHKILRDKNSPFKDLAISEILNSNVSEGVDALSGATMLMLNDSVSVKGAALSCYTMWHWANGEIQTIIRNITGDAQSVNQLRIMLKNGDCQNQIFALQQLIRKNAFDTETVNVLMELKTDTSNELQKLSIEYLEIAPTDIYFSSIEKLFVKGSDSQKLKCLQSLINTKNDAPADFYDSLSTQLSKTNSYQEIDLLLQLTEKKNPNSPFSVEQAMPLLDKNILIARRAYYFLINQDLSATQRNTIEIFQTKNKDYL